jgi:hypothetical protein
MYDALHKRLYVGQPGAVHQHLRDEFGPSIGESPKAESWEWMKGRPDAIMEYGVITPNNELAWYGNFPGEDNRGYSNYEEAAAIDNILGTQPLTKGDMPGVCPKCKGSGADYDYSKGYYHDAQGQCKECGGTGRERGKGAIWNFSKTADAADPEPGE